MTRRQVHSAALFVLFLAAASAHAAGVDAGHPYAWSSEGGWVNFAPTNATVTVSDSALTGYAWIANDGWLNLSPTNGGVTNDGSGNLGGFAWDETLGWVSFTGVTIDSSGRFHGVAMGANETINFDCTSCDVETDWRPLSYTENAESGNATGTHASGSGIEVAIVTPSSMPSLSAAGSSTAPNPTSEVRQGATAPLGLDYSSGNAPSSDSGVPSFRARSLSTSALAAVLVAAVLALVSVIAIRYGHRLRRS
jgi:hypothetical protein